MKYLLFILTIAILYKPGALEAILAPPAEQEVMICNHMDRQSWLVYNYTVYELDVVDHDTNMVFKVKNCGGYR